MLGARWEGHVRICGVDAVLLVLGECSRDGPWQADGRTAEIYVAGVIRGLVIPRKITNKLTTFGTLYRNA